jgi:mRNA interferase MazF
VIQRGSVWWADLGEPHGSRPAKSRPVLVVQDNSFNASGLNTVLVAVITSNTRIAAMPGNVFLPAPSSGLRRDSVVNVTALVTVDKRELRDAAGQLPAALMHEVDRGLAMVLGLRREHEASQPRSAGLQPELTAAPQQRGGGGQDRKQGGRERAAAQRGRRARRQRSAASAARSERQSRDR